jgi:hypothetical protein
VQADFKHGDVAMPKMVSQKAIDPASIGEKKLVALNMGWRALHAGVDP